MYLGENMSQSLEEFGNLVNVYTFMKVYSKYDKSKLLDLWNKYLASVRHLLDFVGIDVSKCGEDIDCIWSVLQTERAKVMNRKETASCSFDPEKAMKTVDELIKFFRRVAGGAWRIIFAVLSNQIRGVLTPTRELELGGKKVGMGYAHDEMHEEDQGDLITRELIARTPGVLAKGRITRFQILTSKAFELFEQLSKHSKLFEELAMLRPCAENGAKKAVIDLVMSDHMPRLIAISKILRTRK